MKKTLLIIGISVFGISCKKESTCKCTQVYTEPAFEDKNGIYHEQQVNYSTFTNTIKTRKKDAESTCKSSERTYSTPSINTAQEPYTTVITCQLN